MNEKVMYQRKKIKEVFKERWSDQEFQTLMSDQLIGGLKNINCIWQLEGVSDEKKDFPGVVGVTDWL